MPGPRRVRKHIGGLTYGPFTEHGTLDGVVIVVGGKSDPVPVHLQEEGCVHLCKASRALAKELAKYLFGAPIRVTGTGRWFRDGDGRWFMRSFTINGFSELNNDPLGEAVAKLRAIPGAWKELGQDPIALLRQLRQDETS